MSNRIEVTNVSKHGNELVLTVNKEDTNKLESLSPGGRMLADSDRLSFIYILEGQDGFVYLSLPYLFWEEVNQGLLHKLEVAVEIEQGKMELTNFNEELEYLISNIDGNANYGTEMVSKVEEIFLKNRP